MLGMLSSAIETGLMVLEPAYRTYKQLKSNESVDGSSLQEESSVMECRELLVHWITYATFRALDCIVRNWLPAYSLLSIGVIVWLRRAGGTDKVYRMAIEPFLAEHELVIDQWLNRFGQARDTMNNATATLSSVAAAAVWCNRRRDRGRMSGPWNVGLLALKPRVHHTSHISQYCIKYLILLWSIMLLVICRHFIIMCNLLGYC